MKRLTIITSIIFCITCIVQSQPLGVRVGANLATIKDDMQDNSTIFAYQIGPFVELEISESLDLHVEALYSRKGTKAELDDETANTDYLEFPALLRYYIEPVFIQAGAYVAFLLSAEVEDTDIKDLLKDEDFGIIVGAGIPVGNLRFDLRYSLGLSDFNDFGDNSLKHAVLTFGAEFAF